MVFEKPSLADVYTVQRVISTAPGSDDRVQAKASFDRIVAHALNVDLVADARDARALWAYRVLGQLYRYEGMNRGEWHLSDEEAITQATARFSGLPADVRAKLGERP